MTNGWWPARLIDSELPHSAVAIKPTCSSELLGVPVARWPERPCHRGTYATPSPSGPAHGRGRRNRPPRAAPGPGARPVTSDEPTDRPNDRGMKPRMTGAFTVFGSRGRRLGWRAVACSGGNLRSRMAVTMVAIVIVPQNSEDRRKLWELQAAIALRRKILTSPTRRPHRRPAPGRPAPHRNRARPRCRPSPNSPPTDPSCAPPPTPPRSSGTQLKRPSSRFEGATASQYRRGSQPTCSGVVISSRSMWHRPRADENRNVEHNHQRFAMAGTSLALRGPVEMQPVVQKRNGTRRRADGYDRG